MTVGKRRAIRLWRWLRVREVNDLIFIVQIVSQGYCVLHNSLSIVEKEFVGFFCLFFKVGKGVAKKSEDKKIVRVVMNYKFLFLLTVPKYMYGISHVIAPQFHSLSTIANIYHCPQNFLWKSVWEIWFTFIKKYKFCYIT